MIPSKVFSSIDLNKPSIEDLNYLFSDANDLHKSIYQYVETKSISKFLMNHLIENGKPIDKPIYRGDSFYEGMVGKNKSFRLWNSVASFSTNIDVAEKFANAENVPDWYFDESEFCVDVEYPFKEFIDRGELLVPVIIRIDGSIDILKLLSTEHELNRFNEDEFILYTEDLEFKFVDKVIEKNSNNEDVEVWIVKPSICERYSYI